MASCCFPDIYAWIRSLAPVSQWQTKSSSLCLCSSSTSSQPSLNLSISKNSQSPVTTILFSITFEHRVPISLWTSKPHRVSSSSPKLLDEETISNLLVNFIEDVLRYGSYKNDSTHFRIPKPDTSSSYGEIFNLVFLTLSFLICIYEAPKDVRSVCLNSLKTHLVNCRLRNASKLLMKTIGPNLEEKWMRSVNLAITNWILELQSSHHMIKTPSPLFSYAISAFGIWKVHLYCPIIAMDMVNSSSSTADEQLAFSLNYHHLEGVMQFNYKVVVQENWVDVIVNTDNMRCNITQLLSENLLDKQGVGATEKHFPSRISLQATPVLQNNILSVSVSKSSENPVREIDLEKNIEVGFNPPNPYLGLKVAAGETITMSLKPWKFEEAVHGYSANFNWFLHDPVDGREVFSSKPSKMAMLSPKAWFKDRYSSAQRPFTRQGGVIFACDEYGEGVKWKLCKSALGKTMEWEIRGWIWLTYWPNKHRTSYHETRRLEFKEILYLPL